MTTFPPDNLCLEMPANPLVDDICLPGNICLSYVRDGIAKIPTGADVSLDFYSQIGPALTPLMPLFDILDTVLLVFKAIEAIPDSITSLNPKKLLEIIPELAEKIDKLLNLIPQLSIPKTVKAAILNMATLVGSIATELAYIQTQNQRIADQIDRAATLGDMKMNSFLVCAQNDLNENVAATSEALKGVGRMVLLINIFLTMIGAEEIPCFGTIIEDNSDDLSVCIDLLQSLSELLRTMANAIPDPTLALTLALGDQTC